MNRKDILPRRVAVALLEQALQRAPIVALLGPRQCGKTTLARQVAKKHECTYFDLESPSDLRQLENPEYVLGRATGLVVIDEIQLQPELFSVLRVLADRDEMPVRFLILGSASPELVKGASQSLAGRVEFVDLHGFDLLEVGAGKWEQLWSRGGFPRSFLAASDVNSQAWRENMIRTYLQRDLPELGIRIPSAAIRRFWTMLAHYHGQTWNASAIGRAMGLSDKTIRSYLDILSDTFMVRQLQPWYENIGKRQVKAPKIYFRDTGLLHSLLSLNDYNALLGHPVVGASWEGFVIEQIIRLSGWQEFYYWATYSGAELDLLAKHNGKRYGVEVKFNDAPGVTRSMHEAIESLQLDHLWVVAPVAQSYSLAPKIDVVSITSLSDVMSK
ncbi:MAG: ATP-binding protein [Lentisphaerae bacterium]|nr:ATP-binding protein [Lentisphaerota bacterium]